jgi:hypothetical protein
VIEVAQHANAGFTQSRENTFHVLAVFGFDGAQHVG